MDGRSLFSEELKAKKIIIEKKISARDGHFITYDKCLFQLLGEVIEYYNELNIGDILIVQVVEFKNKSIIVDFIKL